MIFRFHWAKLLCRCHGQVQSLYNVYFIYIFCTIITGIGLLSLLSISPDYEIRHRSCWHFTLVPYTDVLAFVHRDVFTNNQYLQKERIKSVNRTNLQMYFVPACLLWSMSTYKPHIGNLMIMILPSDIWYFIDLFITDISRIWGIHS